MAELVSCGKCGTANARTSSFCSSCGCKLVTREILRGVGGAVLAVVVLMVIMFMVSAVNDSARETSRPLYSTAPSTTATTSTTPSNIAVGFITVKEVDGKYRYFYRVKNNGSVPFTGSVQIRPVNRNGDAVSGETFTATRPIQPGLATVVYLDLRTGTPEVHGDYGITSFRYEVKD